jgi:hypothetical protein
METSAEVRLEKRSLRAAHGPLMDQAVRLSTWRADQFSGGHWGGEIKDTRSHNSQQRSMEEQYAQTLMAFADGSFVGTCVDYGASRETCL